MIEYTLHNNNERWQKNVSYGLLKLWLPRDAKHKEIERRVQKFISQDLGCRIEKIEIVSSSGT